MPRNDDSDDDDYFGGGRIMPSIVTSIPKGFKCSRCAKCKYQSKVSVVPTWSGAG